MFKKSLLLMLLMAFMAPWVANAQTVYTKVKSANDLSTSDTYILVNEANNKVATTTSSSNSSTGGITAAALANAISNETISPSDLPENVAYITLTASGSGYIIKNGSNDLDRAGSNSYQALYWSTYANNREWVISFSGNNIVMNGKSGGQYNRYIRFDSYSSKFIVQTTTSNGDIALYKETDASGLQILPVGVVTKNSAIVNWQGGTPNYDVYYRVNGETTWIQANTTGVSETSFTLTGLQPVTTYDVRITDAANHDKSQNNYFETPVACAAPDQPNAATNITRTSADITWTDEDHSAWLLCYATGTYTTPDVNLIESNDTYTVIPCNTASYSFENLSVYTTYAVWVRANCGGEDGMSAWSTYRQFTTNDYLAPTNLSVTPTPTGATVTWDNGDDETQWKVYYGTDWNNLTPYNEGEILNTKTCELTGLTSGTQYYVKVEAYYDATHHDKYAFQQFSTLAACPTPTLSDPTNITATSASIDWTPGYEEEAWKVRYSSDNGSNWTVANDGNAITAHPYTLSGLTSATTYLVQVQAFCDPEASEWSSSKSFTTSCGSVNLPQFYNFDSFTAGSYATFPVCWNRIKNSSYPYITNGSGYAYSGSNCVDFYLSSSADEILIFPEINIASYPMNNTQVRFMAKAYYGGNNDILSIGVMTDPTDATTYTEVGQITVANSTYAEYKVKFSDYTDSFTNEQTYIAIKLISTGDYVLVDDVTIEEIPACSKPTAFTCTGVTSNTAKFTWTKGDNETAWQIAYSTTSGFDPDTEATYTVSVTESELNEGVYTLTSTAEHPLVADADPYYARIRSNCNASGYSDWNDDEVAFMPTAAINLTINDGSSTSAQIPFYGLWADTQNSESQFIIPSTLITDMKWGSIKKLTFYCSNDDHIYNGTYNVNIEEVTEAVFESSTLHTWGTSSQTVYSGNLTIADNKMCIELPTPYTYNGGNLMIGIIVGAGSSNGYPSTEWKGVNQEEYTAIYNKSSITRAKFLPKTTFTYVEGSVTALEILDADEITINSAKVNWQGGEAPYSLQYKKHSEENWYPTTPIEITLGTSYTIEGLDVATAYDVRMKSTGDEEYTTRLNYFTTLVCTDPTNLSVTNVTYYSADLSWTAGNALAWDVQYRVNGTENWIDFATVEAPACTLNGLEENTTYQVQVKATCSNTWVVYGETFTTGTVTATEVTAESPFTENLRVSTIPEGWTNVDNKWTANYGDNVYSPYTGTALLLTPMLKITEAATISVTQKLYGSGSNTGTPTCTILASYDGGNTFEEGSISVSPTTGNNESTNLYEIPAAWIGKKLQIVFKYEATGSCKRWQLYQVNIYMATTFTTDGDWNDASKWDFGVPTANLDAIVNAAATIPYNTVAQAKNITIGDNGSLTLAEGGQLICNNAPTVTMQKSITAASNWGDGDYTPNNWYFIASPLSANYTPTGDMIADNYDLYRLNPATTMWENFKNGDHDDFTSLVNGHGYLYANNTGKGLSFTGDIKVYDADNNTVPVAAGWNLIGNPYTFNAYITGSYYVIGSSSETSKRDIIVAGTQGAAIAPCNGVIVEAAEAGNVAFSKTNPDMSNGNQGNLQMTLAQQVTNTRGNSSKTLDNAIVSFNEGTELHKFYFMQQNANLYIPQGNEEYAIVNAEAQGTMPVNFRANENGQYTLTVNAENVEMNYLHLIDNMTGADIDLLQTPSYTFNATVTDYESRFKLVFAGNNEDGSSTGSETFAFYSNGNWIISNEGEATLQVIDINGRILSSETVNGSVSKAINAAPGVYMIRLINGENVKVQKVVIE